MSVELLKKYIVECLALEADQMTQNVIRKDPEGTGKLIIRKLVTYKKNDSRFPPGADVDTEFDMDGNAIVDDKEKWTPDYEKSKRRPRARRHRKTTHLA